MDHIQEEKTVPTNPTLPNKSPHIVALIAIILILVSIIGYLALGQMRKSALSTTANTKPQASSSPTNIPKAKDDVAELPPSGTQDSVVKEAPPAQKANLKSAESYGFTKVVDLPGIGIRAAFPQDTKIEAFGSTYCIAKANITAYNYEQVSFTVYDYSGSEGRREWYDKNIGNRGDVTEGFSASNHSGYISYSKNSDGTIGGSFVYFSVIRSGTMLVIDGSGGSIDSKYFFSSDIGKFKSFLSSLTVMNPDPTAAASREDQKATIGPFSRMSDVRKVFWQDGDLGIKITGPEWIESRTTRGSCRDGVCEYTDWVRTVLQAKLSSPPYSRPDLTQSYVTVATGTTFYNNQLDIMPDSFDTKTFQSVATSLLPIVSGFCAITAEDPVIDCEGESYCYTYNDVITNLVKKKTESIGPYTGEVWGLKASFSQEMDCRGEDILIVKVKGGQYVYTKNIYPEGAYLRIEPL